MWALGDYPKTVKDVIHELGPRLVAACGIAAGERVLDVAAGAGNAAIPAAQAGAQVVASDLTPELLHAGRREASARGIELEWVEADAEALPFADGEFDAVISCIGAMFAPDHRATADELVRVCRPAGKIAMINWTPEGAIGDFFKVFAPYVPPPPPDAVPPVAWGREDHVTELFGDRVEFLELRREKLSIDHFARPVDLREYYKANFGPAIAAYANVAGEPARVAALDRDFADFASRWNRGEPGAPAAYEFEYLLVVARRRDEVNGAPRSD